MGNRSDYGGGGLFQWFNATLTDTNFLRNQSGAEGGGLYAGYAGSYTIRLNGGRLEGNFALTGGGLWSDSSITLNDIVVISNTASNGRGGGVHSALNAAVNLSHFSGNTATGGHGGGLSALGNVLLRDSAFTGNRVNGSFSGGGLAVGVNLGRAARPTWSA